MPLSVALTLVITGMGLKWLVAALDTPFIYVARFLIHPADEEIKLAA